MTLHIVTVSDAGPHETLSESAWVTGNYLQTLSVHNFLHSHGYKLTKLRELATRFPQDTFLFVDAVDTLLVASKPEVESTAARLLQDCDILFSSETNLFAGKHETRWKTVMKPSTRFAFLNSGVILARCSAWLAFWECASDEELLRDAHWSKGTDQAVCAKFFLDWFESSDKRVRVKLDTECQLALNHTGVHETELDWSSWRPRFVQSFPLVIHFNGRSYEKRQHDSRFENSCAYEFGTRAVPHQQGRYLHRTNPALSCDLRFDYLRYLMRNMRTQCPAD
jgi:hypothetical protein